MITIFLENKKQFISALADKLKREFIDVSVSRDSLASTMAYVCDLFIVNISKN
jgi:hypothetical protein